MSEELRGHIRTSMISNFVINLILNGAIAWWLLGGHPVHQAWGDPAYGPDLLITGLLLGAILAGITLAMHRGKARRGEMAPAPQVDTSFVARLDGWGLWSITGTIGVIAMGASGILLGVLALATTSLETPVYVAIKAVWTGLLAAAIVGPATLLGLQLGASAESP